MPRIKLGQIELGILEYLSKVKEFDTQSNIRQFVKKDSIYYQLKSLQEKKLIETRRIVGIKTIKITELGDLIYFAYTKQWKKPIKRVDISKNFFNVRFRSPKQFDFIRLSSETAKSNLFKKIHEISTKILSGSKVKLGRTKTKTWLIQGIALPITTNRNIIEPISIEIYNKVESWLIKIGHIK